MRMKFTPHPAALAAGAVLVLAPLGAAWAADAAKAPAKDATPSRTQDWAQQRQEWVRAKLDRDANRLEIKASQQAAWDEYAKAHQAMADWKLSPPPADADAATVAKQRAERAAAAAQKLSALADATAKLQAALSPEQRKTLDQIVRQGPGHHGGPMGHGGAFGPAGGCDMGGPMGGPMGRPMGRGMAPKAAKPPVDAQAGKK